MFHNLFDSHIHSENSPDGHHSLMYMAEQAERMGLMGIAVTDHVESLRYRENNFPARMAQSAVDTTKASAAFRYRMTFSRGIELGVTLDTLDAAEEALEAYSYDYVLGACHFARNGEEFYDIDFSSISKERVSALMKEYFEDMLAVVKWGKIDALAHLTLPLRWAARDGNATIDINPYRDIIDEILRALAESGKALELNMSGLRGALGDTLPPLWTLRRFKELGGVCVTIGSDAHRVEHVGYGIREGMQMLLDVGFEFFAFYRSRKPVMLRIV